MSQYPAERNKTKTKKLQNSYFNISQMKVVRCPSTPLIACNTSYCIVMHRTIHRIDIQHTAVHCLAWLAYDGSVVTRSSRTWKLLGSNLSDGVPLDICPLGTSFSPRDPASSMEYWLVKSLKNDQCTVGRLRQDLCRIAWRSLSVIFAIEVRSPLAQPDWITRLACVISLRCLRRLLDSVHPDVYVEMKTYLKSGKAVFKEVSLEIAKQYYNEHVYWKLELLLYNQFIYIYIYIYIKWINEIKLIKTNL